MTHELKAVIELRKGGGQVGSQVLSNLLGEHYLWWRDDD